MDYDDVGCVFSLVFVVVMVFVVVFFAARWWSNNACEVRGRAMGFESSYSLTTDCMIKANGQWVPLANYRVM